VGKYTTAQWFAQQLLGNSFQGDHPDLLLISPTNKTDEEKDGSTNALASIKIHQIRAIEGYLSTGPIYAPVKVVIIDDAGNMTTQAANALLKTLEEPGIGRFILIHHTYQPVIPTIESRCQTIPFRRLSPTDVDAVLQLAYGLDATPYLDLLQGCPGMFRQIQHHLALIPTEVKHLFRSLSENQSTSIQAAKQLSALDRPTQIWLVQFLQANLWNQHQKPSLAQCFELGITQLNNHCQAQTVWSMLLGYWVTAKGQVQFPDVVDLVESEDSTEPDVVFIEPAPVVQTPQQSSVQSGKPKAKATSTANQTANQTGKFVQPKLFG
jgi:DNA polymerase III subunit delta'